jgi:hypothetical protein
VPVRARVDRAGQAAPARLPKVQVAELGQAEEVGVEIETGVMMKWCAE